MKKIVKSLILIAAAAMGFTACQEELQNDAPLTEETVEVKFVASSADTKTSVDTSGDTPLFAWGENETFTVLEQTDALAEATSVTYAKVDGKAHITAEFAANPGKEPYDYATIYPASGYVNATGLGEVTLSLPAVQTMAEGSYDPDADLMVSEVVSANAQPTEAQMVRFTRMAAVAKMTLKNFALESGDEVEQVIFTADGKNLAGTVTADLADPHKFTVAEGVNNVTVNTTSSTDVYFTVLPTTLEEGDAYTVAVITNKKLYIKKGTIPEGKTLDFKKGMVTRFGVDLKDVAPSDKWVLVKDASTLKEGDVVTIAAKNYNYAVGKQANNYPIASQTEVIKFGDYLYHPVATAETSEDNRIQHYTLLQRDNNRVAFDFYNAKDYEGDPSIGFVFANGTNSSPKLQDFCDKNTLFDVEITEGVVTLTASEIEKTYKYWRYYHSTSASYRRFDCTTSEPTGNYQICLYKLEGAVRTIPTIDAVITVPASDKYVTIAEEGAAVPTEISTEQVTFNYVGPWTISAEADEEWLNVAYDATKNCLTYTAEANTGANKRETKVTITATLDGQDDITFAPFTVTQKGVPTEITIEEFKQKTKNVDAVYKLTGVITAISASSGNAYTLSDGNGTSVDITYLYTDADEEVYDNASIDLAKGDVVTVTTVVAGSTDGKGGSSSYHSIYKGHYRLTATAEPEIVDYEGGDATISVAVEQNGTLGTYHQPTAIEGSMPQSDFANFVYATGSETATVTFGENSGSSRSVDVTFSSGLAEVTVNIGQKNNPSVMVGWFLVTDASELAVGDKVIIAAKDSNKALAVGSSTTSTTTLPSVDITKSGVEITGVDNSSVTQFILAEGSVEDEFSFTFTKGTTEYYLCASSTSEQLKIKSGALMYYGSWKINIENDGTATVDTIYGTTTPTPKVMRYNATSTKFLTVKTTATDSKAPICLYKYYE